MIRYFIGILVLGAPLNVLSQNYCAKYLQLGQAALDKKDYNEAIRLFSSGKAISDSAQCPTLGSKLAEARRAKAALAKKPKKKAVPAKVEPAAEPAPHKGH